MIDYKASSNQNMFIDIKGANLKGKKSEAVYSEFDIASQQHLDLTETQRKAEK